MRLINAEAKTLTQRINIQFGAVTRYIIKQILKDEPTIDAVPVVRCKDCKHFREYIDRHGDVHMNCIRSNYIPKVEAEHFCSYGERGDEE